MPFCTAPSAAEPLALRIASYVDCHAHALGAGGAQSLAGGAFGPPVLGGLLIIFVVSIGYRLILGQRVGVDDSIIWAAKIGVVLALATASPAYDALVYSVAVGAPTDIAADILPAADIAGSETVLVRLQRAYDIITASPPVPAGPPSVGGSAPNAATASSATPQIDVAMIGRNGAGVLLLTTALGAWLSVRVVMGLLLAFGPVPIASLLFESTTGLFTGWVRTLLGTIVASVGVILVLTMEVTLLETTLAASREATALFVIIGVFSLLLSAVLIGSGRFVRALRLPASRLARGFGRDIDSLGLSLIGAAPSATLSAVEATASRSRAASVAQAVVTLSRREDARRGRATGASPSAGAAPTGATSLDRSGMASPSSIRPGRRSQVRRSGSATRRDAR